MTVALTEGVWKSSGLDCIGNLLMNIVGLPIYFSATEILIEEIDLCIQD